MSFGCYVIKYHFVKIIFKLVSNYINYWFQIFWFIIPIKTKLLFTYHQLSTSVSIYSIPESFASFLTIYQIVICNSTVLCLYSIVCLQEVYEFNKSIAHFRRKCVKKLKNMLQQLECRNLTVLLLERDGAQTASKSKLRLNSLYLTLMRS